MATITALPPILDIQVYAGDDFVMTLTVTWPDNSPVDLTGTLVAQIRKNHGTTPMITAFQVNVVSPTTGVCYLQLTDEQTAALGADGGRHSWDLQLTDPSSLITTLCRGSLTTQLDITEVALP